MKKNDEQLIVCGTDFSATAMEAVDIAAAMARRLETRLVLVHVDQLLRNGASDSNCLRPLLHRRRELDGGAAIARLGN